jgi:hypothetical protein
MKIFVLLRMLQKLFFSQSDILGQTRTAFLDLLAGVAYRRFERLKHVMLTTCLALRVGGSSAKRVSNSLSLVSTDQITSVIVHRADLLAALSALVAVLNLGERLVALTTCCLGCAMQTHSVGVVLGTCVEQRFALFARRGQIFRGCRMRHSALLSTFLLLRKPISGGGRTSLLRLVVIK